MHTALDSLLECHTPNRKSSPDVVSHKATFSLALTVLTYGVLRREMSSEGQLFGPLAHNVRGAFERFASTLERVVPQKYLDEYVLEAYPGDFYVCPTRPSDSFPNLPHMIATLRDILRSVATVMAPWRETHLGVEGLASSVIDDSGQSGREAAMPDTGPGKSSPSMLVVPASSKAITHRDPRP